MFCFPFSFMFYNKFISQQLIITLKQFPSNQDEKIIESSVVILFPFPGTIRLLFPSKIDKTLIEITSSYNENEQASSVQSKPAIFMDYRL